MSAETNLIMDADLAKVREVEFVNLFEENVKKLMEALGVTRKIAKAEGTVLKSYVADGTLEDGEVAEGELIPLSHFETKPVSFKEITLKKWRKATSAEAIIDKGYEQAVDMTTDKMLSLVQKGIRADFFDFLADAGTEKEDEKTHEKYTTGTVVTGKTFQDAIAQAWGSLQVLFEDNDISAVYFVNPMDVADYLGSATVTTQTAFGFTYIKDFLGMGTAILNKDVPKGTVYATASENIVLYYINVKGSGLNNAFAFESDETGYIGIHEVPDYNNMTVSDTVVSGIVLFPERADGIVVSKITNSVG